MSTSRAVAPVAFAALLLAGCSSLQSSRSPGHAGVEGLVYYLPNADIQLTVVKAGDAITAVTIGVTPSYPDLGHRYVLSHERNPVGKSTLNVGVASGLLQSTRATSVSQVADIVTSIAGAVGTGRGLASASAVGVSPCPAAGTFTFVYPTAASSPPPRSACGLTVDIAPLGIDAAPAVAPAMPPGPDGAGEEVGYSGLYFRQNEPYLVTVSNGFDVAAIVFSPTRSPTFRLPVKRSFFADNDADFAFVNGVPTKYEETTGSEVVALLQLPATIVSAYFKAVGAIFDSFKSSDASQANALSAQLALELAKRKYDACIVAIRNKDDATIQQLGCGN